MNKPLTRRLFGKAMAAVPLAAQQAAKTLAVDAAAANAAGQLAMAGVNVVNGPVPMPWGGYALRDPMMMTLWKSGLAPEWLLQDIDREIEERGRYISTDVAALKSVSLSAKVDINRARLRQRYMNHVERVSLLDAAREAYWNEKHTRGR